MTAVRPPGDTRPAPPGPRWRTAPTGRLAVALAGILGALLAGLLTASASTAVAATRLSAHNGVGVIAGPATALIGPTHVLLPGQRRARAPAYDRTASGSSVGAETGVTVYRGTSITSELQIHAETGQLMSDAARVGYVESGGSIEAAQVASEAAHASGIQAWGSEAAYAQAHTEFGTELSQIGPRSMISVTTDPAVAKLFAGPGGTVFSSVVDPSMLIPGGAGESEFLIAHMFGAL